MQRPKFIITGTGRSGTRYLQAILRICGVNCGHQAVFRHENTLRRPIRWDWGDHDGDSSFEAVPLLGQVRALEPDTRIILVTRNKNAVVHSWLKWGLFQDDMRDVYVQFARVLDMYFPRVLQESTPLARAIAYCDAWVREAARHADEMFELESLDRDPRPLFRAVGWEDRFDEVLVGAVSKTINSELR